jgi:O-acetyl-ADP-ribose deacetylase (regulator of RNase III)
MIGITEMEPIMIEYKRGDILKESAEALVNTVNCVGVMGRGIALQFKKAFPDNYQAYKRASSQNEVRPGQMFVYETGTLTNPRYIINFPTKQHWRAKSRIEDIESGLEALNNTIKEHEIRSIALPSLGCGLGGLEWTDVKPRIEASLGSLSGVCYCVRAGWSAYSKGDGSRSGSADNDTR